jgi:hypothetical protein
MFALFKPKCPLDSDEWEWLLAGLKWLEHEFKDDDQLVLAGKLILPLAENFPLFRPNSAEYPQQLFDRVKQLTKVSSWPTKLSVQEDDNFNPISDLSFVGEYKFTDALGTFSIEQDENGNEIANITYHPRQIQNMEGFIATMAHELSHYLMSKSKTPPPGGWELHELATDLTAVWMGFGVFLANNVKSFDGYTEGLISGWQSQMTGYLNEQTILTAMALCAKLRGDDLLEPIPYLKPYLASDLKK